MSKAMRQGTVQGKKYGKPGIVERGRKKYYIRKERRMGILREAQR